MSAARPVTREAWLGAGVLVLGAVFFVALGVGVVSGSMRMHPALGWLLRGFIGLMFGSLAGGALVGAGRTVRAPPRPPAALLARCLGCGAACAEDGPCPQCGVPAMVRADALTVTRAAVIDAVLLTLGATSLVCLGAFVAVGPWIDGERRVWVLCAMAALALLLLLVGAAGVAGGLLDAVARWRAGAAVVARWSANDRWLSGEGHVRGGRVAAYTGSAEHRAPLAPAVPTEGYRDARDVRLAETVATMHAAGLLALSSVQTWRWTWAADDAVTTTVERFCSAELADVTRWREGGTYEAAASALYRLVEDGITLDGLSEALRANEALRAQWDAHAAALREAGVRVPPACVEAVAAAMRSPAKAN
ncbi:MAG: hypothetical protein U0325_02140 [Polyangiales bacterium]